MCFIKLEAWTKVIDNCEKALLIDLNNSKALYRRASALYMKKEYKLALSDLRRAPQEDGAVCVQWLYIVLRVADSAILQVQELIVKCNAGLKAEADKHKKMFGGIFQKKED
jgi:tetratricopeptide (TPR) repeat protein